MSTTSFEKQVLPPNFIEENKQPEPEDNLMMYSSQKLSKNDFAKESEGMATSLPPGFIERRVSDETTFIMSQSMHMNKPIMRFETTLAINIYQIKEVFEKVCKKRGFEIVDDEGDQITAVNKKMLGLKDLILSCIPGPSRSYQNLTAVRLHSKTNKVTCMRKITLKALLGDMKLANTLFLDFEKELEAFNGKRIGISPRQNGLSVLSENVMTVSVNFRGAKYVQMKDDINGDGDESVISTQNLESSSFYEFRKILSSEQYSIGKKAADFVKDFAASYKSVTESAELLPQPMESVYLLVNEITETFFADFNYGKSETKQMMPFCRISVEKYIFDKVYAQLFAMYVAKYNKNTLKYEARAAQIIANSDVISQLKYLDISVKFWLIPKENLDENNNLKQSIEPDQIPYMESIQELNKLSSLKSPREKLGTLLMMHSLMKSAVVDFHKGKEEVCSMDEELPILIYILLHARLKDIHAEFNFVDDYVQFDPALESEKRLMTNLKVSLQYIADEWGN